MNHSSFSRLAAKILVSVIFICLAPSLFAQNDNPTGKSGVFNGNSDVGASYDPYTANATRTIVDLTVPGALGSYPLQFTRTMNSRRQEGATFGFGSGGGWQHSYGWGIDHEQDLAFFSPTPRPKSYIVYYPDGRRVDFQRRASTPTDTLWRGPAGVTDRFQPVAGSGFCYLVLSDGGRVEFYQTATFEQELGYYFELSGPFRIIDPHGQVTTLQYGEDGYGSLFQITEPGGRWLRLQYTPGTSRISTVQAGYGANTVTQSVNYSYQPFTFGGSSHTTLTGVSYSDGTSATYTYQVDNTNPNTGPPLILTCDDVRHPGPMKKIAYQFVSHPSEANGGIYGEFAIAYKWIPPAPFVVAYSLVNHAEQRGDGPQRAFYYGPWELQSTSVSRETRNVPQPYLLSRFTDFRTESTYLGYDANTYLNYIEDANSNVTRFTKTPLTGKILTITHPPDQTGVSSTRQFFYTNQNTAYYLDHMIDELWHRTGYVRDANNRIQRINYPDTATEEFTYNNFGQVVTHKMTSGGTEAFEYDARGRLERYRDVYHDPINKTGKPTAWYQYDSLDRVSGVTDWRGTGPGDLNYTTNLEYNQRGQITKRRHPIDPLTGARYFVGNTYNNDSTLATVTDERGSTTTYGYDDYKRLSSVTAPVAFVGDTTPRVTYLYHDRNGAAITDYRHTSESVGNVTSPLGNTVKTIYDSNFRKLSVIAGTGAEAATTSFTYDAVGNVKTMREPNHTFAFSFTEYFYDSRSRLTDANDALATNRNNLGHTVSWTYDQIGNVKSQQRANNQLITYDLYDPMNRLQVQTVQHDETTSDRAVMTYDLAGNLQTFTDARQKRYTYEYDLLNRKTKTIYPVDDSGIVREERYHFDLANNMDTITDRSGAVKTFEYDNRNRETHFWWNTWPFNTMHERWLSYDPASNITQVRTAGYDVSDLTYDFRNRKTSETQTWGLNYPARTVAYTYDADSNRKTLTYPSGYQLTYDYTTRNQLKTASDASGVVFSYTYDLSGSQRTRTLRNGTMTTYVRDILDRPYSIEHTRGGTLMGGFGYKFDMLNRIGSVKRDGFRGDSYSYYLDDQLKTAQFNALSPDSVPNSAFNTTSLTYDANGNRIMQDNATTPDYAYSVNDLNQYNLVNNATPTYDANGNIASYNGTSYGYNKQNQLSTAQSGAGPLHFYYDGLGRQVLRYQDGQWIYSMWDGWNLIEEYRQSDFAFTHTYVQGAGTDEMVTRFDAGTGSNRIWYYQDIQGSTTHLADNAGNIVEKYLYPPADAGRPLITNFFGQTRSASAFGNRFLYTGREYYKEAAIYDYRNRFYLPSLGRFLQPDPIGFAGGDANLYRYCGNDPVNKRDPFGLLDGGASNTMLPPGYRPNSGEDPVGNIIGWTLGVVTLGPVIILATEPIWVPALVFAGTPQGQRAINMAVNVAGGITPTTPTNATQTVVFTAKEVFDRLSSRSTMGDGAGDASGRTSSGVFDAISVFNVGYNIQAVWVGGGWANFEVGGTRYSHYTAGSYEHTESGLGGNSFGEVVFDRYGSTTAAAANWEASWGNGSAYGIAPGMAPPAGGGGSVQPVAKKKH